MQRRDQTIPASPRKARTVVVNWQQRPGAPNQRPPGQRPDAGALLEKLRIDRSAPPPPKQKLEIGRGLIASTVAGLVVLIGCVIYWMSSGTKKEEAAPPVVASSAAVGNSPASSSAPREGSMLDASGYIVAQRRATVSSKVSGRVAEVLIDEGEKVVKDQVLARLDDSSFKTELTRAQAQLKQAQANVDAARRARDNARPVFERVSKQFAGGFISAQAFDDAKSAYDNADSSLLVAERAEDVSRAAVTSAEENLADTIIRAPFDGVVTEKAAQAGEIVSPLSAGGGFTRTGICTVVDMNSLELEVDVAENFINRVKPAQPAVVRLTAYPDLDIPAKVLAIVPTADRAKATVKVRIGFQDKDPRILPEMGARVAFLEGDAVPPTPDTPAMAAPPAPEAPPPTKTPKVEEPPSTPVAAEKRAEPVKAPTPQPRTASIASAPRAATPAAAIAPVSATKPEEPKLARQQDVKPAVAPPPVRPKAIEPTMPKLAMASKAPAPSKSEPTKIEPPALAAAPAPVIVYPRRIAQKAPNYPLSEKRAGHTGSVNIEVLVLATGEVGDVTVKTSSGYEKLDAAAVEVAKDSWKFVPGTENGAAAPMKIEARVRFSLD